MKRNAIILVLALVAFFSLASNGRGSESIYAVPPECVKYFHDACSPAIGAWLPRVPGPPAWSVDPKASPTKAEDDIVDAAGHGPAAFLRLRTVLGGTAFTYGMAGPPRGSVVYDPVNHIALYDEGCCAWHDVVVAADVTPPPKKVAARSLLAIRTARGIVLGAPPQRVRNVFGAAPLSAVAGTADEATLLYQKQGKGSCDESYAFLFKRARLIIIDYGAAC